MSFFGRGVMATTGARLTLPTANLLAAYDARVGVTNVAGACSAWADQSGNGWNASQGTAGARPAISSTGGFASLLFDGTSDFLNIAGITAAAGTKTVYAVVNPSADASPRVLLGGATAYNGVGALSSLHMANDTIWRNTGVAYASGLQRVAYETRSGSLLFWKNGVAATPAAWAADPAFAGTLRIGCISASTWSYLGHILWLGIYTAARNTAVEDYLLQEFGV